MTISIAPPPAPQPNSSIVAYEHAAGLLAAARALEAATQDPDATLALGPTLACLEGALDALAEATTALGQHWIERSAGGGFEADMSFTAVPAARVFGELRASLEESRDASARARDEWRPLARGWQARRSTA